MTAHPSLVVPALLIAHPGHELRIHGWLENAKPLVSVITDGSGSGGVSRVPFTADIVRNAGCRPGPAFGRFTDAEIYRAIMSGNVDGVADMTVNLFNSFLESNVDYVVGDAWEFYNPVHDLCRVVLDLAVTQMSTITRREVRRFEFAVVGDPLEGSEGSEEDLVFRLDDAALNRKISSAQRYPGLETEVNENLRQSGPEAFRVERLRPIAEASEPEPRVLPYYETHGEKQVRAGRYREVLRYREHFRPFVASLTRAFHVLAARLVGRVT